MKSVRLTANVPNAVRVSACLETETFASFLGPGNREMIEKITLPLLLSPISLRAWLEAKLTFNDSQEKCPWQGSNIKIASPDRRNNDSRGDKIRQDEKTRVPYKYQ